VSRPSGLFVHSYQSPQLRSSPTQQGGKHTVTFPGAPCGRKACIQRGADWFPKGTVYGTAITTPVPCSLQHDTFHLGLSTRAPLGSACRGNPLMGVISTPVTATHVISGTDLCVTLRYGRGLDLWEVWDKGNSFGLVAYDGPLETKAERTT